MDDERTRLRDQILRIDGEVKNGAGKEWSRYLALTKRIKTFKVLDIILTAVSSVGIISFFFHGNLQINVITSFITLFSLTLNLYTSNFKDDDDRTLHADAASELWAVGKNIESLLTDFDSLSDAEARARRDMLLSEVERINSEYHCLNAEYGSGRRRKKQLSQQ